MVIFACGFYFIVRYYSKTHAYAILDGTSKNFSALAYLGLVCFLRFAAGAVHATLWDYGTLQLSSLLVLQLVQIVFMIIARRLFCLTSTFWIGLFSTLLKAVLHLLLLLEVIVPECVTDFDQEFG